MAEISYSTFVLSLGTDTQFLHNISSFLYTTSCGRGASLFAFVDFRAPAPSGKRYRRISARGCEGGWAVSVFFAFDKVARVRACRAERIYALASVCLTWRTGEFPSRFLAAEPGYGRHFFRVEKNVPVRGLFLG